MYHFGKVLDTNNVSVDRLKKLYIGETQLDDRATKRLTRKLKKMTLLEELHLVNIMKLEDHMETLAVSLRKLKKLNVLDLR